jgi:methanogenic corrinoid protein MtbC1
LGLDTAAIAAAVGTLDSAALDQEFSRLASTMPPLRLVRDVALPVLAEIGARELEHPGGIAQEHLVSSTLRSLLGSFLRLYARPGAARRLAFATPAGDRHEIGTLGAAMLAASAGFGVSYLGPDLPAAEMLAAVRSARPRVLVLGLTLPKRGGETARELAALVVGLSPEIELWVGGRSAAEYRPVLGARARILADMDAYQAQLARLSAGGD